VGLQRVVSLQICLILQNGVVSCGLAEWCCLVWACGLVGVLSWLADCCGLVWACRRVLAFVDLQTGGGLQNGLFLQTDVGLETVVGLCGLANWCGFADLCGIAEWCVFVWSCRNV
jgi:hypothetical protein